MQIKQLRARRGVTQEELADRCGLFRTYMSRIESGLANPTLTVLLDLARGLEVTPGDLLAPPDPTIPPKVRASRPVSRGRVTR